MMLLSVPHLKNHCYTTDWLSELVCVGHVPFLSFSLLVWKMGMILLALLHTLEPL